jgi:hypothetical protein
MNPRRFRVSQAFHNIPFREWLVLACVDDLIE